MSDQISTVGDSSTTITSIFGPWEYITSIGVRVPHNPLRSFWISCSKWTNYSHKISPLNKKIPEIEGIRAVAILMVLSFHFFARWTPPRYFQNVYPYDFEVTRQISQFGYLGVQLFFIVSGFVILRSLENQKKSNNICYCENWKNLPQLVDLSTCNFYFMQLA